jgi:phenylalanyl-tRNA synthetase beta chain
VLCGERPGWLVAEGGYDFFDIKGVVERLLAGLRVTDLGVELVPARQEQGFLHPGVAAAIRVVRAGQAPVHVGVVGEVHPETRDQLGIPRACFAFELNLESVPEVPLAQLRAIPRFPSILRDVSFFVDESVPASRVRGAVDEQRPPLLEELRVLEDYREAGKVPAGKKGMLWSMTYRAEGRTLTDAEVDAVHEALVTRLLTALRAERR